MTDPARVRRTLIRYALALPGAWEDHPWGETVAKVGAKVFVFFGGDAAHAGRNMTVKLSDSHAAALGVPGASETGYGLGRSGWITLVFESGIPSTPVLKDWVDESYRLVAPKRLVAELDATRLGGPAPG